MVANLSPSPVTQTVHYYFDLKLGPVEAGDIKTPMELITSLTLIGVYPKPGLKGHSPLRIAWKAHDECKEIYQRTRADVRASVIARYKAYNDGRAIAHGREWLRERSRGRVAAVGSESCTFANTKTFWRMVPSLESEDYSTSARPL